MAKTTTTATMTPAAIAALLGPLDGGVAVCVVYIICADVDPGAVTYTVLATCTRVGEPALVVDGALPGAPVELGLEPSLYTLGR